MLPVNHWPPRFTSMICFPALAAMLVAAAPLSASSIVAGDLSSGTPSFDPATGDAWAVGTSSNIELALGFQNPSASQAYLLSQIQVADNFSVSDPNSSSNPSLNSLIVGFWQNTVNNPNTATELQTWSIAAPGSTGNPGQLYTLNSAIPTTILPNDFYFITQNVTPDGANTAEWGWDINNLTPLQIGLYFGTFGTPGSLTYANTGCTNPGPCNVANDPNADETPAYSVTGSPVPEPGVDVLTLTGISLGLLMLRRRRAV